MSTPTNPQAHQANPGDPEVTDPEATSPERAEAAVAASEAKAEAQPEAPEQAEVLEPETAAEAPAPAPEVEDAPAAPSVEDELAERTEDLQRITAEYANYRRRTERERGATITRAKAQVVEQLLPILDDLDLAERHGDLKEGPLKTFHGKLTGTLTNMGLKAFGAEGDTFDPERHEAVQDLSAGDEKTVGTVLRRGYQLGDQLVRTAMVIIADPAPEAAEQASPAPETEAAAESEPATEQESSEQ